MDPDEKLLLTIYYKSFTTTNLVCKNNQCPNPPPLQQNNVTYEYICSVGDWERFQCSYIGFTTTALFRRLTMHLQHVAINQHHAQKYNEPIIRNIILNDTNIYCSKSDCNRLQIFESLYIYTKKNLSKTVSVPSLKEQWNFSIYSRLQATVLLCNTWQIL